MTWIFTILAALAAIIYGMYQLGPGMNKRREKRQQDAWVKKWKEMHEGDKKKK